jgi:hypothetical protein
MIYVIYLGLPLFVYPCRFVVSASCTPRTMFLYVLGNWFDVLTANRHYFGTILVTDAGLTAVSRQLQCSHPHYQDLCKNRCISPLPL